MDAFLDSVTETLKSGDSITFTGFGKFSTSQRAAREGVNPRNPSQKVHIPAATVPKFSAGTERPDYVAAARSLRREADRLDESQREFRGELEKSRRALRRIAAST